MLYNRRRCAYLIFFLPSLFLPSQLLLMIAFVYQILLIFNVCFVTIIFMFDLVLILQFKVGSELDTSSFTIASVFISRLAEVVFPGISSRRAHGNYISQILAS